MKFGVIKTVAIYGIQAKEVFVETQILPGLPSFSIVGLADKAIKESRERVRSAIFAAGYSLPVGRIIVNLSPANLEKRGTQYDLPIALSILRAMGVVKEIDSIVFAELSLNGLLVSATGLLPAALHAKKNNLSIIAANDNTHLLCLAAIERAIVATNLKNLILQLENPLYSSFIDNKQLTQSVTNPFNNIYGQLVAKRALVIAVAGKHHLLMIGLPGVGKSTLARATADLLPPLTKDEALEVAAIYNRANIFNLPYSAPFRSPHSSASLVSLIGGGTYAEPGEISLAHNGILFLDELPSFSTAAIEALRTPLEEGVVHLARASYKVTYPANIQLIASMNPCRCGLIGCKCKGVYKLSAPILDRIDIRINLSKAEFCRELFPDPSVAIANARLMQLNRGANNATIAIDLIEHLFDREALEFLDTIANKKEFSVRGYHKLMRLARTIADLEQSTYVYKKHVAESLLFRL